MRGTVEMLIAPERVKVSTDVPSQSRSLSLGFSPDALQGVRGGARRPYKIVRQFHAAAAVSRTELKHLDAICAWPISLKVGSKSRSIFEPEG